MKFPLVAASGRKPHYFHPFGVQSAPRQLPPDLRTALCRWGARPTRFLLIVSIARQTMRLCEQARRAAPTALCPPYRSVKSYPISTSAYGIGQVMNSYQTPLGLHRIARKIGAGQPIGTAFRGRRPVGFTWQGQPQATIVHRILWLEGLEPGLNRGGQVDTFARYIYIHGFGDEPTLGRPASHGCIHLAAAALMPLFDRLPLGTLVWITR